MTVIQVPGSMMSDTGGCFLIDIGGPSRLDYGSISDRPQESGYRFYGFREGAMVVASLRRVCAASRCQAAAKLRTCIHQKQEAAIQRELDLKDIVN